MSPWNKDRPPVHPKNTCEFDFKIRDFELNVKCLKLLYSFLVVTCGPAVFVFDAANSHCHLRFFLICE